ncbi:MAG: hypothetical protein AABW79_00775 [Nanoarchaeota archaeon]
MNVSKLFVSLIALIAVVAIAAANVSAFADIRSVTVNGVESFSGTAGVFAGETIPVRVIFNAVSDESDVRVVARLLGENSLSEVTERFDVIANGTYSRLLNIKMPYDIDPNERYALEITVESNSRQVTPQLIQLEVQRASYEVQVLSVSNADQVMAGKALALDIVLKNRGRHFAEDTYVRVRIPELGISTAGYFGDLSPEDQANPDKEDAVERRLFLNIPSDTPAGVYNIEIEASNTDSVTRVAKKVVVTSSSAGSSAVSSSRSKSFGVGEAKSYSITLVNAGDTIQVYELSFDTPEGLSVDLEDSAVAVSAGSSKTVVFDVTASKAGTYDFSVDITSNGELVKRENYTARAEGRATGSVNATILVSVVLAIIFVVLVIVLIVLLTRRPSKEEFGESYY